MYLEEKELLFKELEAKKCLGMYLALGIIEEFKRLPIVGCGQESGGGTCNYCTNDRSS